MLHAIDGINRIRLEFKVIDIFFYKAFVSPVLIESDWNLKVMALYGPVKIKDRINRIRLEFKGKANRCKPHAASVLIESDWNLKENKKWQLKRI